MKRIIFCLVAVLFLCGSMRAQDQRLYWKYKDYPGSISFTIPGFLPKIASIFVKGKDERRLVRRTGKVRIMVFEGDSPVTSKDFAKFNRRAENQGLSELITVREGKTRVQIMGKENGKRIRKLLIMVQDEDQFVMVSLKGRFKYSDLNKLIKKYEKQVPSKKGKDDEGDQPKNFTIPVKIKTFKT